MLSCAYAQEKSFNLIFTVMKNETKLKKVVKFLEDNGIEYKIPQNHGKTWHSDLVIPKFMIFIKIQGDYDQKFWEQHHRGRYPVFIRDTDAPKFVIEKVQNTIIKVMTKEQKRALKNIVSQK